MNWQLLIVGPTLPEVQWKPSWMDDISGSWPSRPGTLEGATARFLHQARLFIIANPERLSALYKGWRCLQAEEAPASQLDLQLGMAQQQSPKFSCASSTLGGPKRVRAQVASRWVHAVEGWGLTASCCHPVGSRHRRQIRQQWADWNPSQCSHCSCCMQSPQHLSAVWPAHAHGLAWMPLMLVPGSEWLRQYQGYLRSSDSQGHPQN